MAYVVGIDIGETFTDAFASDAAWLGRGGYLSITLRAKRVSGCRTRWPTSSVGTTSGRTTVSSGPIYAEVERATVSPARKEAVQTAHSLHRDGIPDDVAGVVGFLLSDDSSYLSGQTLPVNGGPLHR